MRQLEQLLEQFPDTPEHIILHADILRRGLKPSEDLCDAGESACITGIATKLQGLLGDARPSPSMFHFTSDETSVDIKLDPRSPYPDPRQRRRRLQPVLRRAGPRRGPLH